MSAMEGLGGIAAYQRAWDVISVTKSATQESRESAIHSVVSNDELVDRMKQEVWVNDGIKPTT
ncbi:hypothetical protein TWF481_010949 [Arthrobotrys musiformis]|uniref:Uncharacterized protein n=1 Tax=Arthrobotrys musiformis TaxID=47236 RepID=A0AAV9VXZ2_9PEZI